MGCAIHLASSAIGGFRKHSDPDKASGLRARAWSLLRGTLGTHVAGVGKSEMVVGQGCCRFAWGADTLLKTGKRQSQSG